MGKRLCQQRDSARKRPVGVGKVIQVWGRLKNRFFIWYGETYFRRPEILVLGKGDLVSEQGSRRMMFAKWYDDAAVGYLTQVSRKKDLKTVSMWTYPSAVDEQATLIKERLPPTKCSKRKPAYPTQKRLIQTIPQIICCFKSYDSFFNSSSTTIVLSQQFDASIFVHELGDISFYKCRWILHCVRKSADRNQARQTGIGFQISVIQLLENIRNRLPTRVIRQICATHEISAFFSIKSKAFFRAARALSHILSGRPVIGWNFI